MIIYAKRCVNVAVYHTFGYLLFLNSQLNGPLCKSLRRNLNRHGPALDWETKCITGRQSVSQSVQSPSPRFVRQLPIVKRRIDKLMKLKIYDISHSRVICHKIFCHTLNMTHFRIDYSKLVSLVSILSVKMLFCKSIQCLQLIWGKLIAKKFILKRLLNKSDLWAMNWILLKKVRYRLVGTYIHYYSSVDNEDI